MFASMKNLQMILNKYNHKYSVETRHSNKLVATCFQNCIVIYHSLNFRT